MNAVIISGGKQYRVAEGQKLKLEKLTSAVGDSIQFDNILMINDGDQIHLGSPSIVGAQVSAEVISQGRAKKIEIIKFRRRKHHMKRMGHRQDYTEVQITNIGLAGKSTNENAAASQSKSVSEE